MVGFAEEGVGFEVAFAGLNNRTVRSEAPVRI